MRQCEKGRQAEAGFTLLETVIAMTLLTVLMLALSGSIGFVGRNWDKGWRDSERVGTLAQIEATLRRSIEESLPAIAGSEGKQRFVFNGDAQNLQLVDYGVPGRSTAGLMIKQVSAVTVGTSHQIIYRQQKLSVDSQGRLAGDRDPVSETTLLTGDLTIDFSYFGTLEKSSEPAWYAEWRAERRLPELIQVRILDGAMPVWPPIVMRPLVTTDYACIAATFAGVCRTADKTP